MSEGQAENKRSKTSRRRRGRPVGADASQQRRHILACAANIFAKNGPAAASVQDVATLAQVDRRLVYHYFKSKNSLYLEVLTDIYGRLDQIAANLVGDATTVEEFCRLLVGSFFGFCRDNPYFVRVLMWENLYGAKGLNYLRQIHQKELVMVGPTLDRLRPLLADAIAQGKCRAGLDPAMLILSLLGQCLYVLTNHATLSAVFEWDLESTEFQQRWLEHVVRLTIEGIHA